MGNVKAFPSEASDNQGQFSLYDSNLLQLAKDINYQPFVLVSVTQYDI